MTSERTSASRARLRQTRDHLDTIGQLVRLIWAHKLWWLIPLLLSFAVLGALLVVQATPIGPLLYPVF
ncbi:MAG: hypothetical protein HY690_16785 [Chloroflexi bacterium]|nr:hypothetical protein [Chloroflexota bacterium]